MLLMLLDYLKRVLLGLEMGNRQIMVFIFHLVVGAFNIMVAVAFNIKQAVDILAIAFVMEVDIDCNLVEHHLGLVINLKLGSLEITIVATTHITIGFKSSTNLDYFAWLTAIVTTEHTLHTCYQLSCFFSKSLEFKIALVVRKVLFLQVFLRNLCP